MRENQIYSFHEDGLDGISSFSALARVTGEFRGNKSLIKFFIIVIITVFSDL